MKPARRPKPAVARASGVPVRCAFTKIVPAETLKPHPENANTHPAKQLDRYEKVVVGNGWRRAIVVSSLSGFIVKGHGAWQMALRRGWDVPIEVQTYGSTAEERRDMLADNRLAELAETDDTKLAKLLAAIDAAELDLTGFDAGELEKLLAESDVPQGDFPITAKLGESYDYVLIFTTNATEFAFLQNLLGIQQERSYKKTGVGIGRAVPLARALVALRSNRHSLDVQGGDNDHAQAPAKRGGLRSGKPAQRVRRRSGK